MFSAFLAQANALSTPPAHRETPTKRFLQFCNLFSRSDHPARSPQYWQDTVLSFAQAVSAGFFSRRDKRGRLVPVKAGTVMVHLSAVNAALRDRGYHNALGLPGDPLATFFPRLDAFVKKIKGSDSPTRGKAPVEPAHVLRVRAIGRSSSDPLISLHAALVEVAYLLLLRGIEFLHGSASPSAPKPMLRLAHFEFFSRDRRSLGGFSKVMGSPSGGILQWRRSVDAAASEVRVTFAGKQKNGTCLQTVPFDRNENFLSSSSLPLCPVRAVSRLLALHARLGSNLLQPLSQISARGSAGLITPASVTKFINASISSEVRYTAHSLRTGGALLYFLSGVLFQELKKKGRWRSDAIYDYLQYHAVAIQSFSSRISVSLRDVHFLPPT